MYFLNEHNPDFYEQFSNFREAEREESHDVRQIVEEIIHNVKTHGDEAILDYTERFDKFRPSDLAFSREEIDAAENAISAEELNALKLAAERIFAYHEKQKPEDFDYKDSVGARLGWRYTPIRAAGIYVPGGLASYPSSVLMNAIPAKVAGVPKIFMAVPCPNGEINPLVLAAAKLAGVNKIFRMGGAQAIAGFAYGTMSIPHVDKITGPGNAFVAEAKRQVFGKVGIDMIAGPSEVLIIADKHNNPEWIAMDLLSQAEHDKDAQAILLTDNEEFAQSVQAAVEKILSTLPRREIARASWQSHGAIIITKTLQSAAHLSNLIAPEHLQICVQDARALSHLTTEAGAIFLGALTPEAIGDYIGGPNHVLPTSGTARFASGLNVLDFMKRTTFSEMSEKSLRAIGPSAVTLAQSENLQAHGLSISQRLAELEKK